MSNPEIDPALIALAKTEPLICEAISEYGVAMSSFDTSHSNRALGELHTQIGALVLQLEQARNALENIRLLAGRNRTEQWAKSCLRFCESAGVTGSPLRSVNADPPA